MMLSAFFRQPALVVAPRQRLAPSFLSLATSNHGFAMDCLFGQQPPQQVRYKSNRSRRGLYNGKDVGTGNNRSFSMRATKRTFKPNVFLKRVYSETLDSMIRFHLTTSTLRSIDKAGGLDNYLLDPRRKFTEGEGFKWRKKILQKKKNDARFARKRLEWAKNQPAAETTTETD